MLLKDFFSCEIRIIKDLKRSEEKKTEKIDAYSIAQRIIPN